MNSIEHFNIPAKTFTKENPTQTHDLYICDGNMKKLHKNTIRDNFQGKSSLPKSIQPDIETFMSNSNDNSLNKRKMTCKPTFNIVKCRIRFQKRKFFRKLLESTVFNGSDDRPFAKVKVNDDTLVGLLDSGANVCALGKDCLSFLGKNKIPYTPIKSSVRTASGNKQDVIGFCVLPIFYKDVSKNITFYVVPSLTQYAYFGINFWREFALAPDIVPINLGQVSEVSLYSSSENFHKLTPEQRLILEKTIFEFPSYEKLGLGSTDVLQHHIDTGDAVPIKCKHYPLSPPRQEEAFQEIDRLLKLGVIEESNSSWCSPAVLVRKPGKVRLCIDSRKLNEVTKKDSYPLSHINGLLSRLKDTYFMTGIDLKDAFLQIPLTVSSKEKTAFAIPGKPLYHYKYMPFGLCNGPQTITDVGSWIKSFLQDCVKMYLYTLITC